MGNSRPGGTLRPRDGGGTARENAGGGTGTHASVSPAVPARAARSGTNKTVTDAPRLPRRSARNAPASSQERASTVLGNVMTPRSERQQNRAAAEEARLGVPTAIKNSASGSSSRDSDRRDSDRSVGSRKGGEEQMSENASSSSKKRKVMNSRSYIKRFKTVQGANAAGAVVASPDRMGKENTSGGHVADSNISKLCEGSRLIGKNKRDSSDAVSKVSRNLVFGLHETSVTRVNQCSAPLLEEPSTSDCRNTEHVEIDNIAKSSMLLGGATSLIRGVNANHDDTLDTDGVHLESTDLASSQSLVALVGTQAVLSCMSSQHGTDLSAQQNVAPSRCPPAETEQTGLSGTQVVQVLLPEMQPSILILDAPPRKTHPDYMSQTGCEPDRATGLLQEGAASCHHFGDVRMQIQENFDGNVAVDPVLPESPTYPADPVTLHVSTETESQICEPSMAAKQSKNPPAQQTLAISQNPPAEAEQSGILGTEADWDLQTEVQPLISMQVQLQPTEAERACTLGSIAGPDVFQSVGPSLDLHAGAGSAGIVITHDLQSEIQPPASVSSEQITCLPGQQRLATSQHRSAEAEPVGILGTEAACNLQPEVQSSTPMLDEPEEAEDEHEAEDESEAADELAEAERAGTLDALASQDLQSEKQSLTSTQDVPFERTCLSDMPVLQSSTIHQIVEPSLDPHAELEPMGMVTSHDLQSKIQPPASVSAERSTSLPTQQSLASSQQPPAEAKITGILGTEAACDLQPEVQPSTSLPDDRAEAEDEPEVPEVEYEPEVPEVEDEPAEAERARTLGGIPAQDLQPEMQTSTSTQVVQFEQTYLSGMPVVQGPAIHRCAEPSLDPRAGVESVGMVTAYDLQSEILPSATVPAEQNTSLPAQESLATSQHPPGEAKPAGILGTEPACDLQPEVQPSNSVQDEPAEPQYEPEPEDEPEIPEVEDESEAEGEPEIENEPVEAGKAGTLGARATQDLQPEMQSSTSKQVFPFERTHLSCITVLQGPTIHGSVEPSLDPHAGVEIEGMVTAHDLQSEILASTLVPIKQSTTLSAQQSLATLRHLPAEAEPADILVTEDACDLQPLQGEVQPSTSMHDQPAEEPACILGAIAAQSLHPVAQPLTSMQSATFERTYLVGMPVLQSLTLHHSVEPSLDPHARAESMHTLGVLTAHDLQSEVQRSASMQDPPAEGEGAVMLGSTAAQDLQPELQSLTTVQNVPLERIYSEERRQIGFQPNMVPGPEQPIQIPPVGTVAFNNPMLSDDPLKNEYARLMHSNNVLSKDHEHKKSVLLIEYNQEIEKIKKNYDSLLQNEDSTYHRTERELTDLYRKVFLSKSLAEHFRGLLPPSSAGQGRSTSPVMEQPFESSPAAQTAASPVILSSAIRSPMHNSPRSCVRPSFVAQPSSSSSARNAQQESTLPGNLYGTTSSLFVSAPVQYGSYGSAGAQLRAVQPQSALPGNLCRAMSPVPPPHLRHGSYGSAGAQLHASAPHLRQLRMPSPYAIHADQQQLPPANARRPSLRQYAPVIMGSFASTIPQRSARQNSMDSSSVHQTMLPSASSSLPPRPAYSLPSGLDLDSMVNLLQSSSSNPAFFPAQQSWYENVALGSTSGPPTSAPGSQHAGAQIAGANQSVSLSASLDSYLTGRLGLGSSTSPAGAGASPVVVCLSDDESS